MEACVFYGVFGCVLSVCVSVLSVVSVSMCVYEDQRDGVAPNWITYPPITPKLWLKDSL